MFDIKKLLSISFMVFLVMASMVAVVSAVDDQDQGDQDQGDQTQMDQGDQTQMDQGDQNQGDQNQGFGLTERSAQTSFGNRVPVCTFNPRSVRHFENCVQRKFCDGRVVPCKTVNGQQQFRCTGRVHTGFVCFNQNLGKPCNWMFRVCR
jgi:hypothetical protein